MDFKKYLEIAQQKEKVDGKRYLVQRVVKDYEDTWYIPLKSFDTEKEAEEFMNKEWDNDNIDSYRIVDQEK